MTKNKLFVFHVHVYQMKKYKSFTLFVKKVVAKEKHQYLLIDFTVDIDLPVAIRSNVLGGGYERAFLL